MEGLTAVRYRENRWRVRRRPKNVAESVIISRQLCESGERNGAGTYRRRVGMWRPGCCHPNVGVYQNGRAEVWRQGVKQEAREKNERQCDENIWVLFTL